ncbi:hypothetical protein N7532_002625 [Penicillium argentinense]|uniref:Uncharacterized protein n=1 Tax=Penicillium argentinense TaxID=1131581 RepID=A0A9W9KKT2_9EURO|nr:uncharacterized protein N7532_002625 [Penicillium argentinense]KAJ5109980.1 hypothetical protein N7532_002625 [Penicillium argentinense]
MQACMKWDSKDPDCDREGRIFPLTREEGWVGRISRKSGDGFVFKECVSAVFINVRHEEDCTTYRLLSWRDEEIRDEGHDINKPGIKLDIGDCGKDGVAYADFLTHILRAYATWAATWTDTLDEVDRLVGIQTHDTRDEKLLRTLMFDASFRVSEKYFSVLQMLRIFQNWIDDTQKEFAGLKFNFLQQAWSIRQGSCEKYPDVDMESIEKLADQVKERLDILAESLGDRIEKKKSEVESLRDGVSPP